MTAAELIDALAGQSRKLLALAYGDGARDDDDEGTKRVSEQDLADAAEAWLVLARLVRTLPPADVYRGFGAPGNWGYGTAIGAALKRYYDAANQAAKVDPPAPAPLDMVLPCPRCGHIHIDAPEPATGWTNPPHKSHLCHHCGLIWRPADVPTNGVAAAKTKGGVA